MKLYVGNLAYSVTESDLTNAFSEFGEVTEVNLITDKFSGRSKGFAFVEMPDKSEAQEAIDALNETALKGRDIRVNEARPKEDRPRRRQRY
jgi:RNA recognition motif-containing protein